MKESFVSLGGSSVETAVPITGVAVSASGETVMRSPSREWLCGLADAEERGVDLRKKETDDCSETEC